MFVIKPVGRIIITFCLFAFWVLQEFLICKDNFIQSMFDVLPASRYLQMFHICLYVVCICTVRNGTFMHPLVPIIKNIIYVGLFTM